MSMASPAAYDLRLFAAIVDSGSISAAARLLGREKSTVSRDLTALERRLDARLLQRTTRKIALTEAGRVLLEHARRVTQELDDAQAAIEALRTDPRGLLRVTAPHALLRYVLAPRLCIFSNRYPALKLALDPSIQVLDVVAQGFDVALRVGDLPASNLVARKLYETPLVLVASPAYLKRHGTPRTAAELQSHTLIDLAAAPMASAWTLQRRGDLPAPAAEVRPLFATPEPGLVLDMALTGTGVATVPYLYAAPHLDRGTLLPVLPEYHRGMRPIHAVYASRRQLAPKVRAFIDFAAECLGMC
jgi:DNA-binding transcriptional LysR family regulator